MIHPYTSCFFDNHREGARRSARAVLPFVLKLVSVQSVIDVGCGQGTWLSAFRELGVDDVQGIDGHYVDLGLLEIPADRFCSHDLTQPFRSSRTFDLAVSLEVGEHLPASAADAFVDSLTRLATVVLFSAAAPYQGGEHHVNEQWPAYWADRFADNGYLPVDCLRRRVWMNSEVEWWYAQNMFLYVEGARLDADRALRLEYEAAGSSALPMVHPRRFVEWVEWGLSISGGKPSMAARPR